MENTITKNHESFIEIMENIYRNPQKIISGKKLGKYLRKKGLGFYVDNLYMRNWLLEKGCKSFNRCMYEKPNENKNTYIEKENVPNYVKLTDELRIAIAVCEKHGYLMIKNDETIINFCVNELTKRDLVVHKKDVKLIDTTDLHKAQEICKEHGLVVCEKNEEFLKICIEECKKAGLLVYSKDQSTLEKCIDFCKQNGLVVSKKEIKLIEL